MDYDDEKPGLHEVTWDDRENSGSPFPSGIYFYRITVGEDELTELMLFPK